MRKVIYWACWAGIVLWTLNLVIAYVGVANDSVPEGAEKGRDIALGVGLFMYAVMWGVVVGPLALIARAVDPANPRREQSDAQNGPRK